MSGIYLHIPFCKQACSYCDFYFVTRTKQKEAFVRCLIREIRNYRDTRYAEEPIETIYFGGGTPSLLTVGELEGIFEALSKTFELQLQEATLEMNPDDVTAEYLEGLHQVGISRASMGIQSFDPDLLKAMNRAHSREEAIASLELLHDSGFATFTVDLIYGNPGQTLGQLEDDIDLLLDYDPVHISAYALTIEPGTRLGKQVALGRIVPPEDDKVAGHFELLNEKLKQAGIHRYEVSNYCQPGHRAAHNSNYWKHRNYLGMGPGAHSFWWGEEAQRWENPADLQQYTSEGITQISDRAEILNYQQLAEERIMMGLRTSEGTRFEELEERYQYELNEAQMHYLNRKESEGKVTLDESIQLTEKGILLADAIILDLITLNG